MKNLTLTKIAKLTRFVSAMVLLEMSHCATRGKNRDLPEVEDPYGHELIQWKTAGPYSSETSNLKLTVTDQ